MAAQRVRSGLCLADEHRPGFSSESTFRPHFHRPKRGFRRVERRNQLRLRRDSPETPCRYAGRSRALYRLGWWGQRMIAKYPPSLIDCEVSTVTDRLIKMLLF